MFKSPLAIIQLRRRWAQSEMKRLHIACWYGFTVFHFGLELAFFGAAQGSVVEQI